MVADPSPGCRRIDTIGGGKLPDAIRSLEELANHDPNKTGPYCCAFGIAMETGRRRIPGQRNGRPHSTNVEMWPSNFFWPFFTGFTFEEIMNSVYAVLKEQRIPRDT